MKTLICTISLLTLLAACGTLQQTAMVNDDVYNIPDRQAMATAKTMEQPATEDASGTDDYYNPAEAKRTSGYRDYYDLAYNDPYYYNYGRFGFGTGIGSYGPGWGMGLSYGWPTSFGSLGIGYGMGTGLYGYDPYWGNSWMSGYGYSPYYGYNPYGYYGYGNYGYGYGGYGAGYGPYQGPWGGCYGCYEPIGYNNVVYSHRPSLATGNDAAIAPAPRTMVRNPAGLLPGSPIASPGSTPAQRPTATPRQNRHFNSPEPPSRTFDRGSGERPTRSFEPSPSRSTGGNFGGGGGERISSPRPR